MSEELREAAGNVREVVFVMGDDPVTVKSQNGAVAFLHRGDLRTVLTAAESTLTTGAHDAVHQRERAERAEREAAELRGRLAHCEADLEAAREDFREVVQDRTEARQRAAAAEAERDRLQERLQIDPGGSDKIDELESCIDHLRHQIQTLEHGGASSPTTVRKLREERDRLRERVQQLDTALSDATQAGDEERRIGQEIAEERDRLRASLTDERAAHVRASREVDRVTAERDRLREQLDAVAGEVAWNRARAGVPTDTPEAEDTGVDWERVSEAGTSLYAAPTVGDVTRMLVEYHRQTRGGDHG